MRVGYQLETMVVDSLCDSEVYDYGRQETRRPETGKDKRRETGDMETGDGKG
jgi:hypothetical protein